MKGKIISLIREVVPYEHIEEETELVISGVLNSLSIVNLIVGLEDTFDVEIADEMITVENFSNVLAIKKLIIASKKDQL